MAQTFLFILSGLTVLSDNMILNYEF